MPDFSDNNLHQIRTIVREEAGGQFSSITQKFSDVNQKLSHLNKEVSKYAVLFEDANSNFKKALESLSSNNKMKNSVDDHDARITQLETDGKLAKSVISLHSQQLRDLGA